MTVWKIAPFVVVTRPKLFRRKLHQENYSHRGILKRQGGTITPFGFRSGDYVQVTRKGEIIRGWVGGFTNALEVAPDHIHLFVSVKPTDTPHLVVKAFKGRSSFYLRKEFPQLKKLPSLWTSSYFVSTAGNVSSEAVRRYIEDPHHG